jgi:molybdate transport system ATP-binding protein
LILDEPCHGLDPRHRSEVLTIADHIGRHTDSTLLYVTHDPDEVLGCTRQIFEFNPKDWDCAWVSFGPRTTVGDPLTRGA